MYNFEMVKTMHAGGASWRQPEVNISLAIRKSIKGGEYLEARFFLSKAFLIAEGLDGSADCFANVYFDKDSLILAVVPSEEGKRKVASYNKKTGRTAGSGVSFLGALDSKLRGKLVKALLDSRKRRQTFNLDYLIQRDEKIGSYIHIDLKEIPYFRELK